MVKAVGKGVKLIHHEQVQQKKSTNGTMYYRDDIVVGVKLQRVIL